jgi:lipopolysaccharide/colanic/teichoic acid biosynthesis glycosyltransferase
MGLGRHNPILVHPRHSAAAQSPVGRGHHAAKRALDLLGAGAATVVLGPTLLLAALWILLIDGRPVFYSQWRVGHHGRLFRIHKLRTMTARAEADGQARFASDGDPRILRGCAWIRRTHIDELPQLWNILRGQMSLVGPRPERPEIIEQLRGHLPHIERRLAGKPGLTGLAQVRNGYTNDVAGARRKLALDLKYLRRPSVWTDARLIVATVPKVWDHAAL